MSQTLTAPTEYSPEQEAAIGYGGGNVYVAAGPGTGKTHVLVGRYLRLLERDVAPERILVVTFSRRAADELRERLGAARATGPNASAAAEVRTFHGLASRLLQGDGARFRTRKLLDTFARELLLDAAIAQTPMATVAERARTSRGFRAEAARLLDDIARSPADAIARISQAASPRLADLLALERVVVAARNRLGASDLNDLVARATQALADPASEASRWLAAHRYEHVLVDEFQDSDAVQLALLESLACTIFAVGDEAQSIYRFRGARNGIVDLAVKRLAMKRFKLTESRRCPPDVCALAAATPFVGGLAPRSARAEGRDVEVIAVRSSADEVHAVADAIELALDAGTPASEIAVLLRTTRPFGPLLAAELRRRSIPVVENARDALLADARVGALRAALAVLDNPSDAAAWRCLLTAAPLGFDPLAVRLARGAVEALRPDALLAAALDTAGLKSERIANEALAATLIRAKAAWDARDLGEAARGLARGLPLIPAILRDEPPAGVRVASARLRTLCDGLAEAQRALTALGGNATCREIVLAMDDHLAALTGSDDDANPAAIRIMSVHGAKGLEFEFVIIADAVDGRFPQDVRPSKLLSNADRSLLLDNGIDGASVTDAADQEEASLWYVAVTRSKDRLLITYAEEALDGGQQRPSRFLRDRVPQQRTLVARGSLEIAALRSGDPAWRERLRAEPRIAASPVLSAYARADTAAFTKLDARPLTLPDHLSVGSAEDWLKCPRRVFYSRFVGLRSDGSTATALGTGLHSVLERFHRDASDFRSVRAGDWAAWADALHAIRRDVWATLEVEEVAIREATEIFADRVLTAYARSLEQRALTMPFVVEAQEQNVAVHVGPLELQGRIDRLDRSTDGDAHIVDYKSGRAKAKPFRTILGNAGATWDAGESLAGSADSSFTAQLAFYAAALPDVADFSYLYLKGTKDVPQRVAVDTTACDEPTRKLVDELVADVRAHLAEPLAAGTLTTLPTTNDGDTCMFCAYKSICPGAKEGDG